MILAIRCVVSMDMEACKYIYPRRSSNPPPRFPTGFPWPEAALAVVARAPGLDPAIGPQMPASLFALAMLAKSGPLLAGPLLPWTPAEALAEDHNDPKASLPLDVTGLGVGFPSEAADVDEVYDSCVGA